MKVGSSYDSVVRGVSEQVPQDRRPGQHTEQVNLISDPVRGLARRWGTLYEAEHFLGAGSLAALEEDHARMREYTFAIDEKEYTLLYRPHASSAGQTYFMYLYSKDDNQFIPIQYQAGSGFINALVSGGVSAVTAVGRYLYIAGNATVPTYTLADNFTSTLNRREAVVWVRGGAYSRTYRIVITKLDGTTVEAEYTTLGSAYDVLNDTSDIPFYLPDGTTPDPEYQKKLNDRNNLYNQAATEHINLAAESITPSNIATELAADLVSKGVSAFAIDSTVVIAYDSLADITAEDGGDGSLMRAVGNEVSSVDQLSVIHAVGKIVRVRPRGAQIKDSYYMKAYAKSDVAAGTWTEVIWREAAGIEQIPLSMWAFGVLDDGALKVADSPAALITLTGDPSHPPFKANEVGDGSSSPIPNFYGKKVTLLTVFQDRLIVGSEGVISASRPGDYLNFFRHTVLETRANDPVEAFAFGAEGDVLRSSTIFDRDLIMFGDKKQYALSGRVAMDPRSPIALQVMSAHEDSTQALPVARGNFVFYGKQREGRTSVHQLQVGQLTAAPDSVEVSQQLDTYLVGRPAQIIALTSPNTLVFRTEVPGSRLYIYNYIDSPSGAERLFDSWSSWLYADVLGSLAGVSAHKGELLLFFLRESNGSLRIVADRQSLSTAPSPRPHMDSMRLDADASAGGWHSVTDKTLLSAAIGKGHPSFLFGIRWDRLDELLPQLPAGAQDYTWVGAWSPATVTPTNPYMRDNNGRAIDTGLLTLSQVGVSVTATSGLIGTVTTTNGEVVRDTNCDRVLGKQTNVVGRQPVVVGTVQVAIGKEVRECSFTLGSKTWLPLTITSLSWEGQYFNRVRRAG